MQLRSIVAISLCAAACGGGNAGPPDASPPDAYKAPPFTTGVSTLAGAPDYGFVDGDRDTARFWNPVNVIVGPDDKIYVADFDNGAIRRSDEDGNVETVYKDAKFMRPFGLVFDASGALYVSTDNDDTGAHSPLSGTIWKIDTTAKTAEVVVRGIGRARGLAMLPDGKIVMTDFLHQTIRTLDPTTKAITIIAGAEDVPGFADATGADARFNEPYGVVVVTDSGSPSLVVADWANQRLRAVALDGTTSTIAGDGTAAWLDGAALAARFDHPQGVAVAADGTIYVSDMDNFRVRRLANGMVDTIAGNGTGGYADADDRLAAELYGLEGLGLSADGKKLYVADGDRGEDIEPYHRVRVVTITP